MRTKNFLKSLVAATIACCATGVFSSCSGFIDAVVGNVDNPAPTTQPTNDAAQLKQGIWTEYDEALLTSGKYTAEELAQMPAVAMWLQGDKGYFFTYTAETVSETVEGQINYNKSTNTGTITFPYIAGNPLSIQTVNFSMTSDEMMQFEYTYEGKKVTGNCAWLCENLDNWSSDITDEDWKALMAEYENIKAELGPDANIDWSDSEVADLDEPMVWNDDFAATRAGTRAVGVGTVISIGAKILGALFEEDKPDPNKVINDKLDAITGKLNVATAKLDQALLNQEYMMNQMNVQFNKIEDHFDKVNARLKEISDKLDKSEAVKIFNDRNTLYYNKFKYQNPYFDKAYKLYNDNKDDLSKVSADLGELGKLWVDNEQYLKLTWEYIDYLSTIEHSKYGVGMAKIYDGLTLEKYPWEHFGVGDRQNYRSYDMFMITRCLFMINLYATYADGLSTIKKEVLYENYDTYKKKFQKFCEFQVANPDEFLVCQIPGAHFVMHKELQKYNYKGKNNECPHPDVYGHLAIYRPEWHEAGTVKIENPTELRSKLIHPSEMEAIYKYYRSAVKEFADDSYLLWGKILVRHSANKLVAGAKYAQEPGFYSYPDFPTLMLYEPDFKEDPINGVNLLYNRVLEMGPMTQYAGFSMKHEFLGDVEIKNGKAQWTRYKNIDYYAAIVEKRY